MSATTLREPARADAVARHYLRLLANERAAWSFLLTVFTALLGSMNTRGFQGLGGFVALMFFLPLVQWGSAGRVEDLDRAMPVDDVRHELVRVACSAAWAAAELALAIGMVALLVLGAYRGGAVPGFWWCLPLLWTLGVGWYLFGAAVWRRGGRPGSMLWTVCAVGFVPVVFLGPHWMRLEGFLSLREAPSPRQALAWAGAAALWLAAGAAAVWVAAGAPRWAPRLRAHPAWTGRAAARERVARRVRPAERTRPALPRGLRRPARLHLVLWREIVLLRVTKIGMGAVVLVTTVWVMPAVDAAGLNPAGAPWHLPLYVFSLCWSTGVWLQGGGPWRRRAEPLPVGVVAQRLMRVAAGAVWLVATVLVVLAAREATAGGTGGPEAWAGMTCSAVFLYLLGSLPLLVARGQLLGSFMAWIVVLLFVLPMVGRGEAHGRLALGTVLAAFGGTPGPWAAAMLLWGAIATALVVACVAGGVVLERTATDAR